MRLATFFLAATGIVGLFAPQAFARDPLPPTSFDERTEVFTVGHPGSHPRYDSYHRPGHPRHGYSHGHDYRLPPSVLRSRWYGPPTLIYPYPGYPPVYPRHRHICGPGCGCGYRYGYPSQLYYRGDGWGFSFGF